MQVCQQASVGAQLGATTLTLEVDVGFVVMPAVLHQFLHVGEGSAAAASGALQLFTRQRPCWAVVVRDVTLQGADL